LETGYRELEQHVTDNLVGEGHAQRDVELNRSIDVRYAGQSFELSLPIPAPVDTIVVHELDERFAIEHERTYGHRAEGDPVEVVHIRVEGRIAARIRMATAVSNEQPVDVGPRVTRPAYFGPRHGLLLTRLVARNQVGTEAWPGPLIIEEYDATSVIPPGWSVRRDNRNNLLITLVAAS
jgi:N-methylhydantoinase A